MSNATYAAIGEIGSPHPSYTAGYCSVVEQLEELWDIDTDAYGDCSIDFLTFQSWWLAYPQGSINICSEGRIVASIGIYPVSQQQYQSFISGEIQERQLTPLTEEQCQTTPQSHWYFSGIVLSNSIKNDKYNVLKLLLSVGTGSWYDRGHLSYPANLFALGYSKEGERMLARFGFGLMHQAAAMPDRCPLYHVSAQNQKEIFNQLKFRGL